MRITIRICAAGDRWMPQVPRVDFEQCFPKQPNGRRKADPKACCAALLANDRASVYSVSGERKLENCIACEILADIRGWMDDNELKATDAPDVTQSVKRILHRAKFDRYAFVRLDIREAAGNRVKVAVTHTDNGIVMSRRFDHVFAMKCAEAVSAVANNVARQGVTLEMSEYTRALLDDLTAFRNERKNQNETNN